MSYHTNFLHTLYGTGEPCCEIGQHPIHRFLRCCNMENDSNTIVNTDNEYVVSLDVPGVSKENLEIKVDDRVLTVKTQYENKEEHSSEQRKYMYSIKIPEDSDTENIDIVLNQGVLKITMPKNEKAKPKLLEIKEVA